MTPKVRQAKKGQRVSMVDNETLDGEIVHGTIVEQLPDRIIIKWDDIDSNCEHFEDEWGAIGCE